MLSWAIIGCGYTGACLVRALTGHDLTITRRDPHRLAELVREHGVRGVRADLADPGTLTGIGAPGAIAVCLAPPGADPEREIAHLLVACASAQKLIYVSSTGVYAPGAGAWVDEGWPLEPSTEAGRARLAAETALAAAAIPTVILRAAGIHGPGRSIADRIRSGTHRIVGDGTSHVSRIHVEDLATAIVAAGTRNVTGVFNVADDDPAPIGEVADAIADRLGVAPSPRVSPDSVSSEIAGMLAANRRIANTKMKQLLGIELRFPSWRDA